MYCCMGKVSHTVTNHMYQTTNAMKGSFHGWPIYPMCICIPFLASQVKDDGNAAEDNQELETVAG